MFPVWTFFDLRLLLQRKWCHSMEQYINQAVMKMVPFYGRVYKSSRYDLIIPLPACESGAEREKRHAVVFASGKTGTNSASLSFSRNGDSGNPLAAGEILPPFCVYAWRVAAVAARGKVNHGIPRTLSDFLKKILFCTCILDFCNYIKLVNDN